MTRKRFGKDHQRRTRRRSPQGGERGATRRNAAIEPLEPRLVLALFTVNSTGDTLGSPGYTTLRGAIYASEHGTTINGQGPGTGNDTIAFAANMDGAVIQLNQYYNASHKYQGAVPTYGPSAFIINSAKHDENLEITSQPTASYPSITPLSDGVTILRGGEQPSFRLFFVEDAGLTLDGLTLKGGKAEGFAGGDSGPNAGAGGGSAGMGGAVLAVGTSPETRGGVTLIDSTLSDNEAVGGKGGDSGVATLSGAGGGGGMGQIGGAMGGGPNGGPAGGWGPGGPVGTQAGGTIGGAGGGGGPGIDTSYRDPYGNLFAFYGGGGKGGGGGGGGGGAPYRATPGGGGGFGGGGAGAGVGPGGQYAGGASNSENSAGDDYGRWGGAGGPGGLTTRGSQEVYMGFGGGGGFGAGGGGGSENGDDGASLGPYDRAKGDGQGGGAGGGGAGLGGAICAIGGSVYITNSTIANNTADGGLPGIGATSGGAGAGVGGGIFGWASMLNIRFATIAGNTSDKAGALAVVAPGGVGGFGNNGGLTPELANPHTVIVCSQPGYQGGFPGAFGLATSLLMSDTILAGSVNKQTAPISDFLLLQLPGGNNLNAAGVANIIQQIDNGSSSGSFSNLQYNSVDPLLYSLEGNGGPTETMAEQASSPAIDAGSWNGPYGMQLGSPGVTTDQRGVVRDTPPDIGAFEQQGPGDGDGGGGGSGSGSGSGSGGGSGSNTGGGGANGGYYALVAGVQPSAHGAGQGNGSAPSAALEANDSYFWRLGARRR